MKTRHDLTARVVRFLSDKLGLSAQANQASSAAEKPDEPAANQKDLLVAGRPRRRRRRRDDRGPKPVRISRLG